MSDAAHAHAHDGAHHDHGHPNLQHQFDTLEQQKESSTFGMWLFLVTEIMFFGGLFCAYLIYRRNGLVGFAEASHELDITLGTFNTAVLILSSLTMALGVWAAQLGKRKVLTGFLVATMALGSTFLVVKYFEYSHKFHEHHVPGPHFIWDGDYPQAAEQFYSIYFAMTGLHALHMIAGILVLGALLWPSWKGKYGPEYFNPIEVTGLYWHFVDIVWIFLFPLLYLIGRH